MLKLRRAMTGQPDGNVPCNMVYIDDLKAWLRGKYRDSDDMGVTEDDAYYSNKLLDKLRQEIEDAEKEG